MTTDKDLAAMVRGAIPDSELHPIDPDVITTAAARRRARRRTVILAGVSVAALTVGGATLLSGPTPPAADLPAAESAAAAEASPTPTSRMAPGCVGPVIEMKGGEDTGFVTMATRVGVEVTVSAIEPSVPSTTILEGALVVGRPGTTYGLYVTDLSAPLPPLPATDITHTGNQVARQALRQGEQGTLRFTPPAPGDYPVYWLYKFQNQGDCTKGLTDKAKEARSGVAKVGTIHVS